MEKFFFRAKYYLVLVFHILLLLCYGCTWFNQQIPIKYELFFELPLDKQVETFKTLSLDEQIEICVIEKNIIEPPNLIVFVEIASKGEEIVPFLLEKLQKEKNEQVKEVIIEIFDFMSPNFYNLRDKQEIIKTIKLNVSSIKSKKIREGCEETIRNIEKD